MTERPPRGDRARERVRRDGVTARRAQPSKLAVLAATGRRNDVLPQQASERKKKSLISRHSGLTRRIQGAINLNPNL